MINKCAKWVRHCSLRQYFVFCFIFLLGKQHNMRHCLFFQGKRFSLARPAVNHMTRLIWLKIISRSLPVPKVLRTCLHRLRWLLKCFKRGLRNAALHPGRCTTLVCAGTWSKKKRSSNPLEVWIRVTPLLCGFSSSFSFFLKKGAAPASVCGPVWIKRVKYFYLKNSFPKFTEYKSAGRMKGGVTMRRFLFVCCLFTPSKSISVLFLYAT